MLFIKDWNETLSAINNFSRYFCVFNGNFRKKSRAEKIDNLLKPSWIVHH